MLGPILPPVQKILFLVSQFFCFEKTPESLGSRWSWSRFWTHLTRVRAFDLNPLPGSNSKITRPKTLTITFLKKFLHFLSEKNFSLPPPRFTFRGVYLLEIYLTFCTEWVSRVRLEPRNNNNGHFLSRFLSWMQKPPKKDSFLRKKTFVHFEMKSHCWDHFSDQTNDIIQVSWWTNLFPPDVIN